MWTGQELTMADSLMISALGILVVFAALAALAIAIIIISKILGAATRSEAPKPVAAAAAPAPGIDEEAYAVIIAAVNEEARLSGETVRITSIKEL